MSKFFKEVVSTINSMTVGQVAGLESFASNPTTDIPESASILSDATVMSGFSKQDLGLAFQIAGKLTAGTESFTSKTPVGSVDEVVTASDLGMGTFEEAGTENFRVNNLNNVKLFTIGLNVLVSKANQGLDEIMPVIMLNSDQVGIHATTELESIMDGFVYDSLTNKSKVEKTSALQLLRDGSIFNNYSVNVMPVKSANTDGVLYNAFAYQTTVGGVAQQTAPIRFKKQVNLFEITQTAASIAAGYNDELTSLDTAMWLENIYLGKSNGTTVNQAIRLNVRDTIYSNWTYTQQDDSQDLALSSNFQFVLTPSITDIAGAAVTGISDLPVGTRVVCELLVSGSANAQYGTVTVLDGTINVLSATDVNGADVTATELTTIKATVAGLVNVGYDLDVRLSNNTLRNKGIVTTQDIKTTMFYIPQHPPVIKYKKAFVTANEDNMISSVTSEIITIKAMILNEAFKAIDRQVAAINGYTGAGKEKIKTFGIGRAIFEPTLAVDTFDGATDVKTMSSKDGYANVRGSIALKLISMINTMIARSGFGLAKSVMESGEKTIVNIWVQNSISMYFQNIGELLGLGDNFVVKVHVHHTINRKDPIITFGTTNTNRTSELNPFQFGNVVIIPSIVYDGVRAKNGATVAGTYTVPTFAPIINQSIIGQLKVSNLVK